MSHHTPPLKVGSLFAGYGGLDLAIESVLHAELTWYAEFDTAPSKIMAHHWPDLTNYGDVTKVDWAAVPPVDVITGGSPCQDLSHAGKRAGMKAGTRSGLWASMCDAVETIRPRLVVWENVRGALSAEATSSVEPCPSCVGDEPGVTLRALGRVLGDLAELGYDAWWYGLRAADVGAAHGRFRVFVFAAPRDAPGLGVEGLRAGGVEVAPALAGPRLPDGVSADAAGAAGVPGQLTLLPTPAVNDMGRAYTPQEWDAWTAKMQAAHGNGNGHGKSREIEAQRLLPTPTTTEGTGAGSHGTGGDNLRTVASLLPTPTTTQRGTDANLDTREGARANLHNEVMKMLPTPRTQNNENRQSEGYSGEAGNYFGLIHGSQDWREYDAAIRRQETTFGRPAPMPTEPGKNGPRLSPAFVEWLMGLPAGHVTDPAIGLSRNDQLKALGNGVVPQQAAAACRAWLADIAKEAAA